MLNWSRRLTCASVSYQQLFSFQEESLFNCSRSSPSPLGHSQPGLQGLQGHLVGLLLDLEVESFFVMFVHVLKVLVMIVLVMGVLVMIVTSWATWPTCPAWSYSTWATTLVALQQCQSTSLTLKKTSSTTTIIKKGSTSSSS